MPYDQLPRVSFCAVLASSLNEFTHHPTCAASPPPARLVIICASASLPVAQINRRLRFLSFLADASLPSCKPLPSVSFLLPCVLHAGRELGQCVTPAYAFSMCCARVQRKGLKKLIAKGEFISHDSYMRLCPETAFADEKVTLLSASGTYMHTHKCKIYTHNHSHAYACIYA